MTFSIIIPNYNGTNYLEPCLKSLITSLRLAKVADFEIIIIDNASTDDSVSKIKKLRHLLKTCPSGLPAGRHGRRVKNLKFKINATNLGFAAAVNQGIRLAKHPLVVPCNNDLTLHPDWFKHISATISQNQNPQIATFCGTVLNHDGTRIESQGLEFFICGKCLNINHGKNIKNLKFKIKNSQRVWGSSAALVVYRKDILQKTGLFDEDFFAYLEDVDLSFRLHHLGYQTLLVPKAICYHLGGGTSSHFGNLRQQMTVKNWLLLIFKRYSFLEIFVNFPVILIERLRNLSGLIKATPLQKLPQTLLMTYGQAFLKLPSIIRKRC